MERITEAHQYLRETQQWHSMKGNPAVRFTEAVEIAPDSFPGVGVAFFDARVGEGVPPGMYVMVTSVYPQQWEEEEPEVQHMRGLVTSWVNKEITPKHLFAGFSAPLSEQVELELVNRYDPNNPVPALLRLVPALTPQRVRPEEGDRIKQGAVINN